MPDEKICMQNEYCTDCPERAKCPKRITFYNQNQFFEELSVITTVSTPILAELGISENLIALSCVIFLEKMNKKRDRELQEHPIYSNI
jgi:hypothetical protein